MFKKLGATALITLAVSSNAFAGEAEAYTGIAADAATTAIALAAPGIVEANPLGWATVPIRLAMVQYAKSLPPEEGQPMMVGITTAGWGAAANNLLVLAGAGAAAPIGAIAVMYALWQRSEPEREFWAICAEEKKTQPHLNCVRDLSGKTAVASAMTQATVVAGGQ